MSLILRSAISGTTKAALSLYKVVGQKKASPINGKLLVNLGCGMAVTPGWTNIDGSLNAFISCLPRALVRLIYGISGARLYYSKPEFVNILKNNKFIFADLANSLPLRQNSVDAIFSSHFLETLRKDEALKLLKKSYKALKPGGILRISVPDLAYAISLYPQKSQEMLDRFFYVDEGQNDYSSHKYLYDYHSLEALLLEVGFTNIKKCDYQEGNCPDVKDLDNRPEESLFVECQKGNS